MSYFAFIPKEEALTEGFNPVIASRNNWLSLIEADKMICKHFGIEADPKWYYKSWKDFLYYAQSASSIQAYMGIYKDFIIFEDFETYIRLFAFENFASSFISNYGGQYSIENLQKSFDEFINNTQYREIFKVIYDAGYVLVGVVKE